MNRLKCPYCNYEISNTHVMDWLDRENKQAQDEHKKEIEENTEMSHAMFNGGKAK